jgi:hypothetical protein
MEMVVIYVVK